MKKNKYIIILFVLGLLIMVYPYASQFINSKLQERQVEQFHDEKTKLNETQITEYLNNATKYNQKIFEQQSSFHDPFAEGANQNEYKKVEKSLVDESMIASIEIPVMDLSIPIYLGSSEASLSRGVGQVEGTSLPVGGKSTHTVLAGHRGMGTKEMFRNLDVLHEGDTFLIHTLNETLKYKVYKTDVVLPHETEELEVFEGKDLASLITCHPYRHNSHRLVVFGERIE